MLEYLAIHKARELVGIINDPGAAVRTVEAARRTAPGLHILVRARYLDDVQALSRAGATRVVSEEMAAAVDVTTAILERHSVDQNTVEHVVRSIRARDQQDQQDLRKAAS